MKNTYHCKEFAYGREEIINLILPIITLLIGLPMIILGFLADIIRIFISIFSRTIFDIKILVELAVICLACGVVLTLELTIINSYNTIRTSENGLSVRIFIYGYIWKMIPWEDVIDLQLANRVDKRFQPIWLIIVKRLTFWHKQLGISYGIGSRPCLVLTSDISNRWELLEVVRGKLGIKEASNNNLST